MRITALAALASAAALLAAGGAAAQPAPGVTELVSQSSAGVQGNQDSVLSAISADGRFVAFASLADNLVPGDTNESVDIFVRDRLFDVTERVSVNSRGRQGNGHSGWLNLMGGPSISGDGRYVAFSSEATNLVPLDLNRAADVFVHDRLTGETTRVSVASDGSETGGGTEPDISRDGRFVAFVSFADDIVPDGNFTADVFLHDRRDGDTVRISQAPDGDDANGQSFTPHLAADGRFVYFSSFASNLVRRDTDNGDVDAYLFDRRTDRMIAITSRFPSSGVLTHGMAGDISGTGRFVTFTTQDVTFVTPDTNGFSEDAWLLDRETGTYELIGVNDAGEQGDDSSFADEVSDDGRFALFVSRATNLGGPQDFRENVYLRDRVAETTRLVSVASDGTEGDLDSIEPALTPDGLVASFSSRSTTFVPETQEFFAYDIFVRDMRPEADVSVHKADSPDPVPARSDLTYTLTVRNDGPGVATDVTLVDRLPDGVLAVAAPGAPLRFTASQGSCRREGTGRRDGTVVCELGELAAGASATVELVVRPAEPGTLVNVAEVLANEPDADQADNTATQTTTAIPR